MASKTEAYRLLSGSTAWTRKYSILLLNRGNISYGKVKTANWLIRRCAKKPQSCGSEFTSVRVGLNANKAMNNIKIGLNLILQKNNRMIETQVSKDNAGP